MDWRLIAALSSAGVSLCLVAVGAYVVLTSGPTLPHSYAPPPSLLTTSKPGNVPGATVASLTPNAPGAAGSRPAASRPTTGSGPARPAAPAAVAPSLAPPVAAPSPVVAPSVFAPTPVVATEEVASPFAPNYALPPDPVVTPTNIGAAGPPTLDLARQQEPPKPSLLRREPKHEHAAPAGPKMASLTPSEVAPRHEPPPHPAVHEPPLHQVVHEPPPRPVVEVKKPTIVPEIHTAPPAAHYQGVLTSAEIARIHHNLRLSPDQEPRWPPVEAALAEMGRQQISEIRHGQEPRISPNDWPPQRLYSIAGPLLMSLRPDQKDQVRRLCHSLGFEAVASLL
jgi:hypothetical protein